MSAYDAMKSQVAILDPNEITREDYLRALASDDPDYLKQALGQIAALGQDRAMEMRLGPRLSQLMMHQDHEVVSATVMALAALGTEGKQFSGYFSLGISSHPSTACRMACLEALAKLGPTSNQDVINAVQGALSDQDPTVRVNACLAMGGIEAIDRWQAVSEKLSDDSAKVRGAAMETMGLFVSKSQEVESMFTKDEQAKHLSKLLADDMNKSSGLVAVTYLGPKAPPSVVSPAIQSLSSKDINTRQAAVSAVGALGSLALQGESELKALLKDQDAGVKAAAASACGALGKEGSTLAGAVAELLSDDSEDASSLAIQIGCAKRTAAQLRRPKCAALYALARMGEESMVGKISADLNDSNWEVRLAAAEALGALGEKAKGEAATVAGLLEDDVFPVRAMACSALAAMKDADTLPRLIEALEDQSHTVRTFALGAIGEMGASAEEYSHDIFKLLNDPVNHVKGAAAKCLSKLGDTGANYVGVIATLLYHSDLDVRVACLEALGNMGTAGAALADEVYEFCDSKAPAEQRACLAALEKMGVEVSPFYRDSGAGPGVPVEDEIQGEFKGLGLYYAEVQKSKSELRALGQWPEGVI